MRLSDGHLASQVNCLTEIFVQRALARASELDEYLKTNGRVVGPLHGLPISLKDQHRIKGLETTMGKRCLISVKLDISLICTLYRLCLMDWRLCRTKFGIGGYLVRSWRRPFRANQCPPNTHGKSDGPIRLLERS